MEILGVRVGRAPEHRSRKAKKSGGKRRKRKTPARRKDGRFKKR